MKVLGIVGSPPKGGNTEILVRKALTAAKEAGGGDRDCSGSRPLSSPLNGMMCLTNRQKNKRARLLRSALSMGARPHC